MAGAAAIFEAVDFLRQALDTWMPAALRDSTSMLVRLIEALAATARHSLKQLVSGDAELRRIWQVIDLILATLRGATLYGLAFDPRGFDAINELDSREWLRMNGASEESLDSDFMRGVYDLAFAFEDGDVERPRLAASVGCASSSSIVSPTSDSRRRRRAKRRTSRLSSSTSRPA